MKNSRYISLSEGIDRGSIPRGVTKLKTAEFQRFCGLFIFFKCKIV
uniref:Uncharacterized protein n=1 Tax=Podoviridae sp. ctoqT5 TaxID=2826577 RepID=A0A8S5MP31_9CAUD|nr:MAG TPA: hypothetical protein [Podoviridae sp. ctoqT5]